jgi:hypothetical protein
MRPTAADRDELACPDDGNRPSVTPADGPDLAALWLDLGGGD